MSSTSQQGPAAGTQHQQHQQPAMPIMPNGMMSSANALAQAYYTMMQSAAAAAAAGTPAGTPVPIQQQQHQHIQPRTNPAAAPNATPSPAPLAHLQPLQPLPILPQQMHIPMMQHHALQPVLAAAAAAAAQAPGAPNNGTSTGYNIPPMTSAGIMNGATSVPQPASAPQPSSSPTVVPINSTGPTQAPPQTTNTASQSRAAAPTTADTTAPSSAHTSASPSPAQATTAVKSQKRKRRVPQVASELPLRLLDAKKLKGAVKPKQVLVEILQSDKVHSCTALDGFFHEPTQAEIDAYDTEVLTVVRNRDLAKLREFHGTGRTLKCSNRFGESLLHLACRKGYADVTKFLVETAQVPIQVKDDFGRTPLHDACWTCEPDFELMDVLIGACPDLLVISDVRGHLPLDYTRRQHWDAWNAYLRKKGADALRPRTLK